jgi:pilus assembly protein CpaB
MKSKTLILVIVAVGCGLGASYMTSRLLAERGDNKQAEEEKIKVLVAKKNVPQGTFIKNPDEWFIEKEFGESDAPKKAVRTFDEVKDRVLNKPLSAEQWVIADDLLRKDQAGLQAVLPKGMRAMAIKVNVDTVVAGFVQPNSRVDVINTVGGNDKDSFSRTILQNMLILAIDSIDTRDLEKKAIVSSTVTLAVTPDEAQALSMALKMGELRLVLRPPGDEETVTLKETKPEDVKHSRIKNAKQPGNAGEEDPEGTKSQLVKLPDVPLTEPAAPAAPATPAEPPKPKKPWVLAYRNGDEQGRAFYHDDEDGGETQIEKIDSERTDKQRPTAPDKPTTPTPDKPAKRQGGKQ